MYHLELLSSRQRFVFCRSCFLISPPSKITCVFLIRQSDPFPAFEAQWAIEAMGPNYSTALSTGSIVANEVQVIDLNLIYLFVNCAMGF
jgi:hypothetical protein